MYYQVLIETSEKVGKAGRNKQYFELDKTDLTEIEERIVYPFLRKEDFQFDGYFLKFGEIKRITIKETQITTQELSKYENDHMPSDLIMFVSPSDIVEYDKHTKDITTTVFDKAKSSLPAKSATKNNSNAPDLTRVFIVHGRDNLAKTEAARFIEKLGFSAIILHEQVSSGKTIIEKIEAHTNVGFAIVLYTPCDAGGLAGEKTQKSRARQNVVFEHGYLIGKLGRHNVCALVKGDVEIPNDISGVVYVPLDRHGAWHLSVAKELRNAGYSVDMNKII
ncbi:MAG TPA: nucleotide-binding protein [Burkholderiaceae bacterium]|nr:nucleotide-binding protein [Burkholderiaceae bacterium]